MNDSQTVIIVGTTETDSYGHLWVTPAGGGARIKIAKRREALHSLFQQGKAVMLKWQTYMDKPYVADAKLVAGELREPKKPTNVLPEHKEDADAWEINTEHAKAQSDMPDDPRSRGQAEGMVTKELGDMMRASLKEKGSIATYLIAIFGDDVAKRLVTWYRSRMLGITKVEFDGSKLPKFEA